MESTSDAAPFMLLFIPAITCTKMGNYKSSQKEEKSTMIIVDEHWHI